MKVCKAVRIGVWVMRFLHNSRNSSSKTKGPLNTDEVEKCQMFLVKRAQLQGLSHAKFDQDQEQLNLQPSEEGVLECRGRIQGEYPIYLPDSVLLAANIVQRAHVTTLHGGVGPNHGESKREVLDTPSSEIDEESREKMHRMQTFSSRGLCKSARETRLPSTLQRLCLDLDLDRMQQLQPGFECRK